MPISQLLCEGEDSSPDARVLGKLLAGICEVKPLGSKYGMGTKIIARREVLGPKSVFGILDGDFIKDWRPPENKPIDWKSPDGIYFFGWRWERKEIENYLIDPAVVSKALGEKAPDQSAYSSALETARDSIAIYQAARTALSASRVKFTSLPSSFGRNRGKEKHLFPDALDKASCYNGILSVVGAYNSNQVIPIVNVEASFEAYISECQCGSRYQNNIHAFAGKDLLWAMDQWLIDNNFTGGARGFREKILVGIQETTEDIANWLPEWKALKERINQV